MCKERERERVCVSLPLSGSRPFSWIYANFLWDKSKERRAGINLWVFRNNVASVPALCFPYSFLPLASPFYHHTPFEQVLASVEVLTRVLFLPVKSNTVVVTTLPRFYSLYVYSIIYRIKQFIYNNLCHFFIIWFHFYRLTLKSHFPGEHIQR